MQLEEQIKLAVEGCGVTLYEIGTVKDQADTIFRVTITSADGISLDKCQEISNIVSPLLDVEEPLRGKYRLEVSSPGIERKLKSIEHVRASVGENIRVKEYSTETFRGKLDRIEENDTLILIDNDGDEIKVKYEDVLSASTYYDWK